MLYVVIEAERARLKKLYKENELITPKSRLIPEDKGGSRTEQYGVNVLGQRFTKEPVSSYAQSLVQDSEWFMLSPQEKLAWAKVSKDPRIAAGQQSPLDKKILNLGGVHTSEAKQLIIQKYQEEYELLCREQGLSLDYWLAKAESYYNKRIMETVKEEEKGSEIKKRLEGKATQSTERRKRYYLLPEREMKHIERHIHRGGQVREFKSETLKQLPPHSAEKLPPHSTEIKFPRIVPGESGIQNTQRRKQVNEREQMQIKDHRERMIRGRELTEQKLKEGILRKDWSQPPLHERCENIKSIKKEIKEYESVIAYPLFQPCNSSRIKVNVLMEKSQNREENNTIIKPLQRRFLTMPPFLRSQVGKIKDLVLS